MRDSETEILIDPIILALVWSQFASDELRRNRTEEGEEPPSDLDDDNYYSETSTAVFGEQQHNYPLNFFKSVLLFTTRIRTPFSGKKFTTFKEILYDQLLRNITINSVVYDHCLTTLPINSFATPTRLTHGLGTLRSAAPIQANTDMVHRIISIALALWETGDQRCGISSVF